MFEVSAHPAAIVGGHELLGASHVIILSPSLTVNFHPSGVGLIVEKAPPEPLHTQLHPVLVRLLLDGVFGLLRVWLSPFQELALIATPYVPQHDAHPALLEPDRHSAVVIVNANPVSVQVLLKIVHALLSVGGQVLNAAVHVIVSIPSLILILHAPATMEIVADAAPSIQDQMQLLPLDVST